MTGRPHPARPWATGPAGPAPATAPDPAAGAPRAQRHGAGRVLVLRALGLGDLLTAVPALRALRRGLPGRQIVLAAPARLADAARATGLVDRLLPTTAPGRAVPRHLDWSGPPPEVAVDLHGNGPPSHLLLDRLHPAHLLAYAHPDTPHIRGPQWRPEEHERHRWCRLLSWYGLPADPDDLRLPAPKTPAPAAGTTVLHPGADAAARRWPPRRFAAVARALRADGHHVVVTAGAAEAGLAAEVAELAGLPAAAVFGGGTDVPFDQLAALVAAARAVVVGDTGLAHLASALGTPSVVLFGPVAPRLWGPPRTPRHRVLWHPDAGGPPADPARPGDAHGTRPDERLLRITPDEVVEAVRTLVAAGPHEALALPRTAAS